jgi:probable phosphoglycerate mutase
MNNLSGLTQLKNSYFVMRHGKSKANEEGIILSHPEAGTTNYGLVEEGKRQTAESATHARDNGILDSLTIIVSSDFTRAKETAEITRDILGAGKVILTPKLRERYFGTWEKKHNRHYQDVWDDDINDPHHKNNDVESTSEVLNRTTALIKELEERYSGEKILLVSHEDALQILKTAFEQVSSAHHSRLPHLNVAEIRELSLK